MAFNEAAAWAHIDSLAAEHGITVKVTAHRSDSEAFIAARTVWVPERMTKVNYLVALHELGHVACDLARRLHYRHVHRCSWGEASERDALLACEAAAWAWAWNSVDAGVLPKVGRKTVAAVAQMWGTHLVHQD